MKLHARYVTVSDFDDQYFEVSFGNEHPAADYDPDAPMRPYVLIQRQFEDEDGGVCYLETHDPDRYVGHLRLRLVEFTPSCLAFEIERPDFDPVMKSNLISKDAIVAARKDDFTGFVAARSETLHAATKKLCGWS